MQTLRFRPGILLLLAAVFLTLSVTASENQTPVRFEARLVPAEIRAGEKVRLAVEVELQPAWHIYSVVPSTDPDAPPPTRLETSDDLLLPDGPAYETAPVSRHIPVLGMTIDYHNHQAWFYRNLELKPAAVPGNHVLEARLTFQLCTDTICLPPASKLLKAPYRIVPGDPRPEYRYVDRTINPLPGEKASGELAEIRGQGFWPFVALAALMGFISLLTPCVFPMIPITVTFFSKQAEGSHARLIKLAGLFALGIVFTYTVVGLLLSALFGAGSALLLASNPLVNLVIAAVFIIFALSLMGLFNISLPAGVESYFDSKARSLGGVPGVLLMGFTFTLTAFTCTVQFVGTMLIAAAQGEWVWPLAGMLVFSSVFAFPFFLLAMAPGLIRRMQGSSGEWLGRSKVVLGILELMASVKFLSNADLVWQLGLLSRNTAIAVWTALLVAIAGYLSWTGIRPRLNRSVAQWVVVAGFAILAVTVSRGWNDRSLGSLIDAVLPPVGSLQQLSAEMAPSGAVPSSHPTTPCLPNTAASHWTPRNSSIFSARQPRGKKPAQLKNTGDQDVSGTQGQDGAGNRLRQENRHRLRHRRQIC